MEAALAWFMPGPFRIALPRGEKLKTFVCLASHNILEHREFVTNSQRLAERIGAEKMVSAKQAKARARSSPPAVSMVRVESLVCTVEMIGPSRSTGAGRDALPVRFDTSFTN